MKDPRETFYSQLTQLQEFVDNGILEIAYDQNIGLHELFQFYSRASDWQIEKLEYFLKTQQYPQVIDLLEEVTGTRLIVPGKS